MTKRDKPPLPTLDAFPSQTFDTIRYCDTDNAGHVNNAIFATFFETGRTHILIQREGIKPEGTFFSLVRAVLEFHAEVMWPGQVEIGTRVLALGRTSITLSQGIFFKGQCVTTAETVMVLMDRATRRPTPLPEATIARLKDLMV